MRNCYGYRSLIQISCMFVRMESHWKPFEAFAAIPTPLPRYEVLPAPSSGAGGASSPPHGLCRTSDVCGCFWFAGVVVRRDTVSQSDREVEWTGEYRSVARWLSRLPGFNGRKKRTGGVA